MPATDLPDAADPLVLNTGRVLEHWHTGTMTRRSKPLNALQPEAFVEVHAQDARALGLHDGQRVRVRSRRGEVALRARITVRLRPGTVPSRSTSARPRPTC